jgi:hypothetical protein
VNEERMGRSAGCGVQVGGRDDAQGTSVRYSFCGSCAAALPPSLLPNITIPRIHPHILHSQHTSWTLHETPATALDHAHQGQSGLQAHRSRKSSAASSIKMTTGTTVTAASQTEDAMTATAREGPEIPTATVKGDLGTAAVSAAPETQTATGSRATQTVSAAPEKIQTALADLATRTAKKAQSPPSLHHQHPQSP